MRRLPIPDPVFGSYLLPDGSRIYPSGSASHPVRPGYWFVWLRGPDVVQSDGTRYADGNILMNPDGIRYFCTPREALQAIRQERKDPRESRSCTE